MITRSQWRARPPKSRTVINAGQVTHLFLHHAAGNYPDGFEAMRRIQNFHMDSRGWADFAYSVGVAPDGQTFAGRGWDTEGGHTKGWNSRSVAICYLGFGTNLPPDAALRAIMQAADDADNHFGRKLVRQGHRDVGATACPGDGLYRWWTSGGQPAGTPIVTGSDTVTLGQALEWAAGRNAAPVFLSDILPALHTAARTSRVNNGGRGTDFAVLAAQSAKETGYGRFGGVLDTSFHNTAGIKTASGGGNFDPAAHQRFTSWADGARAHANHLAAYVGLRPTGVPHGRFHTVRRLSWAGTITTVEELGAKWAPNPEYGRDIVRMMGELRAVPEPATVPEPVRAPKVPSGGVVAVTPEVSAGATTGRPASEGWANRPSWVRKSDWQRLVDWTKRGR